MGMRNFTTASEAQRLYERAGFVIWGTEPEALRYKGQAVIEYHMGLSLKPGAV